MKLSTSAIRLALADMHANSYPYDALAQIGILCKHFNDYVSPSNHTRSRYSPLVGKDTKFRRPRFVALAIRAMRQVGIKFDYLDKCKPKHVKRIVEIWDQRGLATRTLQTRLAAIRMVFHWMGREKLLPCNRELLPPHRWKAVSVAVRDKTWIGNGIDVEEVASGMTGSDTWIKFVLLLARYFGLRMKEATLLRPHEADGGDHLKVWCGTKGGRRRVIPITTKRQRELLDAVKAFTRPGESLIGPRGQMTWKAARRRLNQVMRDHHITRALARVTPYGLRVEFACERYLWRTGERAPVCGGNPVLPKIDRAARQEIARLLGHGRRGVTSAYIGRVLRQKRTTKRGGLK